MPRNSSVNFYLKPKDRERKSVIFLQFKYSGHRLVFSFGQRIDPDNWSKAKQRVKNKKETTADGKFELNDLLDNLETVCLNAYNIELKNGIPAPATLRKHLEDFLNQNHVPEPTGNKLFTLINRFIDGEIQHKGRDKSPNTIKTYRTLKGHLEEYQYVKKEVVDLEAINLDFYYKYVSYLRKRKQFHNIIKKLWPEKTKQIEDLSDNSISKDIQILKVIMGEAVDLGFTSNLQFKHKKFQLDVRNLSNF